MREFFVQELNGTRTELLRMGALAEKALSDALLGIVQSDLEAAGRVKALEEAIDSSNRTIYDRCLRFINLQAPVASDTRYITGILEAIVSIERIGDYADELADVGKVEMLPKLEGKRMYIILTPKGGPPTKILK